MLRAKGKIGHGDLFLHAIVDAVNVLVVKAGQMQDRFADRLAGDRSGVDGDAADDLQLLDQRYMFAEFRCLDGGALARGAGADDDEIVLFHGEPLNCCVTVPGERRKYITVIRDAVRDTRLYRSVRRRSDTKGFLSTANPRFLSGIYGVNERLGWGWSPTESHF